LTNPHSGGAALLRGLNITAARQRRPTLIGRQPEKHGTKNIESRLQAGAPGAVSSCAADRIDDNF